jgi:hypothetical protein
LSYTDGTPQSTIADGNGDYWLTVSPNWSGTVTPSKTGYTFSPASRTYSNVQANKTGENYIGIVSINVTIGSTPKGTYDIPSQGSMRVNYPE